MKTFLSLFVGVALCFATSFSFAQGITLELFRGSGPSQVPDYTTPIPLTSAQYSFTNTINIGSQSTGTGAGRAGFPPMVITKQIDPSTAAFQKSLFSGGYYRYARLNFYRADGSLAYRVVLGLVVVSNYAASGVPGCPSGCPSLSESISLEYGQVATYNPAAPANLRLVTWNRVTNTSNVDSTIPASAITD
ncbi:type VI secretion system tube protein Hcp [Fibrella forsythiae]|uniref:Type VI secretion system tube protein Hcp n=1 Tax=Fibrella forsythiae TaxID=2817061 RepID=A0ABS3JIL6_9BACT|nr:type VI secretion system tube protein Hcp [Fibrella forsythiae]MBO0949820.1 type VI secretion system tube protein Hcp [Fibrella forsythiae]